MEFRTLSRIISESSTYLSSNRVPKDYPKPVEAKDGTWIPRLPGPKSPLAMHSIYRPDSEFAKSNLQNDGLHVILGRGSCLLNKMLLPENSKVWYVDFLDTAPFFGALSIDHPKNKGPQESHWIVLKSGENLKDLLDRYYHPSLWGDLQIHINPVVKRLGLPDYLRAFEEAKSVAQFWKDNLATQNYFAKIWQVNQIHNLQSSLKDWDTTKSLHGLEVVITGAGPSLEDQIDELKTCQKPILATDTSLQALAAHGIRPWGVVVLDAQAYSLRHFYGIDEGFLGEGGIFAELSCPPELGEVYENIQYYFSDHPFTFWLEKFGIKLPRLITSGGNVSQTALSLAQQLGAQSAELVGMDFSYPGKKAYARGTFLHQHWLENSNRHTPLEQGNHLMVTSGGVRLENGNQSNDIMKKYRAKLIEFLGDFPIQVIWEGKTFQPKGSVPPKAKVSVHPKSMPLKDMRHSLFRLREKSQLSWYEILDTSSPTDQLILHSLLPFCLRSPEKGEKKIFSWLFENLGRYFD